MYLSGRTHHSKYFHSLTPWCESFLRANWFAASQEIPHVSRNPKVHYRTHKHPPPVSILGQPNPVHIPTSHLLEIHPNIIHPSTPKHLYMHKLILKVINPEHLVRRYWRGIKFVHSIRCNLSAKEWYYFVRRRQK